MRIAVLSDIHGNLEAFEAVRADLERLGADKVVCLGDNIGYGPDPEAVVRRLLQLGYESTLGNHEFALMDAKGRRWLNFQAAENNIETEKLLSAISRDYCCSLPTSLEFKNGLFVHGYPPDSVFRYLEKQSDQKIGDLLEKTPFSVIFLGHTHRLQLVYRENGTIIRRSLGREKVICQPEKKYIFNCGSVGQPRDGDNRAKYLLWDQEKREVEVRFVVYDNEMTMSKIKELGFSEIYALRLR